MLENWNCDMIDVHSLLCFISFREFTSHSLEIVEKYPKDETLICHNKLTRIRITVAHSLLIKQTQ